MSLQDKASIIWNQGAPSKAGFVAAWNPQAQALVNFPVTRATTKTRVNEAGLIESVAANVLPRDFTNGGCGDFAIEPQSTNIVPHSRNLASGWNLSNTTTNSITSGIFSTGNDTEVIENATTTSIYGVDLSPRLTTLVTTNTYVLSVTVKKGARDWIYIKDFNGFQSPLLEAWFNINTGTIGTVNGPSASGSIVALSNGYYRCSLNFTANSVSCDFRIAGATANNTLSYTGVVGNVAFVFAHAQAELGDYASSHILTTGSIVTRNKDVPRLTGSASLLNDSEGGLFVEALVFSTNNQGRLSINNGSSLNRTTIDIFTQFRAITTVSGAGNVAVIAGGTPSANVFYKVGTRYSVNDFAIYEGGTLRGSDSSGVTFALGALNTVSFNDGSTGDFYGRIRQLIIFNQAPTNAQLASLTS